MKSVTIFSYLKELIHQNILFLNTFDFFLSLAFSNNDIYWKLLLANLVQ